MTESVSSELAQNILDSVNQGFEQQLDFTRQIMALDSTRGNERPAQQLFHDALARRGYDMDQWAIDVTDI